MSPRFRTTPPTVSPELTGPSAAAIRLRESARRASLAEASVLLVAEAGVDVASIARDLHAASARAAAPFVHIDCVDADLAQIGRMLFGVAEEGPADLDSISCDGAMAAARGGTLFLEDVTELPAAVQARLARIARDGQVRRDGAVVATNVWLIASAPASVDEDVRTQRVRADLVRRLSGERIDVPSLRERPEDVEAVAQRLLESACVAGSIPPRTFTKPALALLAALTWPGNIAELRSVITRVVSGSCGDMLRTEDLLPSLALDRARSSFTPSGNLRQARLRFERDYIAAVLQHHGWRMADAAQTLGIQRPNLYRKARQLGIPLTRLAESAGETS